LTLNPSIALDTNLTFLQVRCSLLSGRRDLDPRPLDPPVVMWVSGMLNHVCPVASSVNRPSKGVVTVLAGLAYATV
jgi:hypothetical protein